MPPVGLPKQRAQQLVGARTAAATAAITAAATAAITAILGAFHMWLHPRVSALSTAPTPCISSTDQAHGSGCKAGLDMDTIKKLHLGFGVVEFFSPLHQLVQSQGSVLGMGCSWGWWTGLSSHLTDCLLVFQSEMFGCQTQQKGRYYRNLDVPASKCGF